MTSVLAAIEGRIGRVASYDAVDRDFRPLDTNELGLANSDWPFEAGEEDRTTGDQSW